MGPSYGGCVSTFGVGVWRWPRSAEGLGRAISHARKKERVTTCTTAHTPRARCTRVHSRTGDEFPNPHSHSTDERSLTRETHPSHLSLNRVGGRAQKKVLRCQVRLKVQSGHGSDVRSVPEPSNPSPFLPALFRLDPFGISLCGSFPLPFPGLSRSAPSHSNC